MSVPLYTLTEQYQSFLEFGDEQDIDVSTYLDAIGEDIKTKVANIGKVRSCLKAEVDALKQEGARLERLAKQREERLTFLNDYVARNIAAIEGRSIKSTFFSVGFQNSNPSCEIVDETKIPEEFIKIKKEFDRKAMIERMKKGEGVPGAVLRQGEHLRWY